MFLGGGVLQVFGACTTPNVHGMARGSLECLRGRTYLGLLGEVAEERGSRPDSCRKFLTSGGPIDASFWGGNMDLDGNDAAKTGRVTHDFLEAGVRYVGT